MKASIIAALLLSAAFLASAQAKLAPIEPFADERANTATHDDTTISSGPAGALLESNYFNAPQPPLAGIRNFSCRPQFSLFEKRRLARAC
jgi:hypothetical protein